MQNPPAQHSFLIALIFLLALFTAGCVEECEDPDTDTINALRFQFGLASEGGFSEEELNSALIIRYFPALDTNPQSLIDTLPLRDAFEDPANRILRISNNYPWLNAVQPYYPVYSYLIVQPETGYSDTIRIARVEGTYRGECVYENLSKNFVLNGDTIDVTGSTQPYLLHP